MCGEDVVTVIVPPLTVDEVMFRAAGIAIVHVPLTPPALLPLIVICSPFR